MLQWIRILLASNLGVPKARLRVNKSTKLYTTVPIMRLWFLSNPHMCKTGYDAITRQLTNIKKDELSAKELEKVENKYFTWDDNLTTIDELDFNQLSKEHQDKDSEMMNNDNNNSGNNRQNGEERKEQVNQDDEGDQHMEQRENEENDEEKKNNDDNNDDSENNSAKNVSKPRAAQSDSM